MCNEININAVNYLEDFDFFAEQVVGLGDVFLGDWFYGHRHIRILETKNRKKETSANVWTNKSLTHKRLFIGKHKPRASRREREATRLALKPPWRHPASKRRVAIGWRPSPAGPQLADSISVFLYGNDDYRSRAVSCLLSMQIIADSLIDRVYAMAETIA